MKRLTDCMLLVSGARAARVCAARAWWIGAERHRHGQFRNLLQSRDENEIQRGRRAPPFILVRRIARHLRRRPERRSELRDVVLGHRPHALGQPVRGSALAADDRERQGRHRQGTGDRLADAARKRLPRGRRDPVLEQRRDQPAAARARLREGDGTPLGRQQGRRRSAHLLGALGGAGCFADRQDLRAQSAGGRNARADVQADAETPRHRALHHSHLRRAGAGAESAAGGARAMPTLRRSCRTRSTCRRTPSRASASGRNRYRPTPSRLPKRRRPTASARRCTRATT